MKKIQHFKKKTVTDSVSASKKEFANNTDVSSFTQTAIEKNNFHL